MSEGDKFRKWMVAYLSVKPSEEDWLRFEWIFTQRLVERAFSNDLDYISDKERKALVLTMLSVFCDNIEKKLKIGDDHI